MTIYADTEQKSAINQKEALLPKIGAVGSFIDKHFRDVNRQEKNFEDERKKMMDFHPKMMLEGQVQCYSLDTKKDLLTQEDVEAEKEYEAKKQKVKDILNDNYIAITLEVLVSSKKLEIKDLISFDDLKKAVEEDIMKKAKEKMDAVGKILLEKEKEQRQKQREERQKRIEEDNKRMVELYNLQKMAPYSSASQSPVVSRSCEISSQSPAFALLAVKRKYPAKRAAASVTSTSEVMSSSSQDSGIDLDEREENLLRQMYSRKLKGLINSCQELHKKDQKATTLAEQLKTVQKQSQGALAITFSHKEYDWETDPSCFLTTVVNATKELEE